MRVYEVETRNFTFQVCCMGPRDFPKVFRKGWRVHCKEYDIPYDPKFVKELITEYEHNWINFNLGTMYRDFNTNII